MSLLLRAAFLAFVLAPGIGFIPVQAKDSAKAQLHWLTPAQIQALVATIPDAPAPGSQIDRDDLAAVLKAQAVRTLAQTAQALAEESLKLTLFQSVLGPNFNPKDEPKIYGLIDAASHDVAAAVHDAKDKWKRPRPFLAHAEVHPVHEVAGWSYPSGHATSSYARAVLLGEIFPDKKEALLQEAAEIAQNRVIGGVHYPSDIAAGQQFGRAIAQALLANPDFQKKLAAAKEEALAPAGK